MRTRASVSTLLLALTASGCTLVAARPDSRPAPDSPAPPTAAPDREPRQFGGRAHLGGEAVEVVLELSPDHPPGQAAVLRIPDLSLEARGKGTWSGQDLRVELTYGDSCPGTIRLRLNVDASGDEATGTMEASDCTGSQSGPVSLLRRGAVPPRPERSPSRQGGE